MSKLITVAFLLLFSLASFADTYTASSTKSYIHGTWCIYANVYSSAAAASAACLANLRVLDSCGSTVNWGCPDAVAGTSETSDTFYFTLTGAGYTHYGFGAVYTQYTCPSGGTVSGNSCINAPACIAPFVRNATNGKCELPPKSNGGSSTSPSECGKGGNINFGNPINAGTGNKWQHEVDLSGGAFNLGFDRYCNASTVANSTTLGAGWSHAYSRSSTLQSSNTWVTIRRNDGKEYNFSL
ncbi:MAG: DUF6531 domain-containing protein, partial [Methylobacter sp.]